ncbi:torsin-4A-B [Xenopus laevis]|uniref:Torsin-4A-B n=1 Tax=Xenopus laevis TaxID=8355 RepID=TO4AB_XENLA|nr:torsin-4A-B [Xenopus laevis]Q3KQ18.1 RecName: Full=Torsin-4A-B; AltName: Full=Torsin family 4 member A-B [Xenopus laevis]AAI06424.1 MGC131104 protein [Xenopus laevis]
MEESESQAPVPPHGISLVSSPVRAVIRIRRKIRTMKKSRLQVDLTGERSLDSAKASLRRQISMDRASLFKSSTYEKQQYFNFDTPTLEKLALTSQIRKRNRNKSRHVLYPGNVRKCLPVEQKSKAKRCLLLFVGIVCFQIFNAIENLDDNLQKYDLDGLEKTLQREVFGQTRAIEKLMDHLKDYLATHYHNKPLVLSFNGPSGVGKSHTGRLLAKHFRSVVDNDFVLQYYTNHNCPNESDVIQCQAEVSAMISQMISRAEIEEKIPVFLFDEVEAMPVALLDVLHSYFQLNQSNEYLNVVYILISNIGGHEITKFVLQNVSNDFFNLPQELHQIVLSSLRKHHSLWDVAEIVPFTLLEKRHILDCFLDELLREGFYPDHSNIESLAGQLRYYIKGNKEFSISGCKQVVAKVNLLQPYT